ncbi:hypothetical protein SAMN02745704_00046 [Paucidesulfovibrio gracilis DSM 16080]|uniref:Negative regulator of RcsB-dependent stress response n=1 Tax=Paucidesulfovibrio gracilis DSM 16080 TaxID=1121449 RepID=A0A1T4W116_9BACT|nr:hypothetical protein [Paucidesulfovibrio gracilis]SKA70956.1 hypothetical protein SAMN02745704_00046 [Paucidesulfovibrio gracilis DSM 16080]
MSEHATKMPVNEEALAGEVNQEASRLLDTLLRYKNIILGGAAALIAVAAVYAGVTLWNAHSVSTASEELGQILLTTEGDARVDALAAFVEDAPDAVRNGALFELADVQMRQERYQEAVGTWERLEASLQSPELSILAKLGKGRSLLLDGHAAQAQEIAALMQSEAPEAFLIPVNRLLAAAAEEAGDTQTALEAYQALLSGGQVADASYLQYKVQELQAK